MILIFFKQTVGPLFESDILSATVGIVAYRRGVPHGLQTQSAKSCDSQGMLSTRNRGLLVYQCITVCHYGGRR
jgi:hypothetical protein